MSLERLQNIRSPHYLVRKCRLRTNSEKIYDISYPNSSVLVHLCLPGGGSP